MTTKGTINRGEWEQPQWVTLERIGIAVLDSLLERVDNISFAESEYGRGAKAYYIPSIDHLLKMASKHNRDIGMKNQAPHFFNGRFWQRVAMQPFQHFLQDAGMRQGIPYPFIRDHQFIDKLVKQFTCVARFPVSSANAMPKINLQNGTLHFTADSMELKPFDKRDGLTYQLRCNFDRSATAPLFKAFMERVLPDQDMRKLLFQYIGYIFLPGMNLDKVLFLYGGEASGISVFLNVIKALVGNEQCCAYSLERLTNSGYCRTQLGNYILNECSEISTSMGATDILKKLASREPLQTRSLSGKQFNIQDYATSIFSMNKLPKDTEQTGVFSRRFLIVPFNVRIHDNEQDPDLAKKIIDSEISGVLKYVVRGARSLLRDGKFDNVTKHI